MSFSPLGEVKYRYRLGVEHASDALEKARRARVIVEGVLDRLNVGF